MDGHRLISRSWPSKTQLHNLVKIAGSLVAMVCLLASLQSCGNHDNVASSESLADPAAAMPLPTEEAPKPSDIDWKLNEYTQTVVDRLAKIERGKADRMILHDNLSMVALRDVLDGKLTCTFTAYISEPGNTRMSVRPNGLDPENWEFSLATLIQSPLDFTLSPREEFFAIANPFGSNSMRFAPDATDEIFTLDTSKQMTQTIGRDTLQLSVIGPIGDPVVLRPLEAILRSESLRVAVNAATVWTYDVSGLSDAMAVQQHACK